MEPSKKRIAKSRVNGKSVKRRLDFSNETETVPIVPVKQLTADPRIAPSQDIQLSLGGQKFLTYGFFNGEARISIRLYELKGSLMYPTKTGISMTPTRFSEFRYKIPQITEGVIDMAAKRNVDITHHLFNAWYVSTKTSHPCVNIRKFFYPPNHMEAVPTKTGITLTIEQWKELLVQIDQLIVLVPDLVSVPRCVENHGDGNLLAVFQCTECSHASSAGFIPQDITRGIY